MDFQGFSWISNIKSWVFQSALKQSKMTIIQPKWITNKVSIRFSWFLSNFCLILTFSTLCARFSGILGISNIFSRHADKIRYQQKKSKKWAPKFFFVIFQNILSFSYSIPFFVFLAWFLAEMSGGGTSAPPMQNTCQFTPCLIGLRSHPKNIVEISIVYKKRVYWFFYFQFWCCGNTTGC